MLNRFLKETISLFLSNLGQNNGKINLMLFTVMFSVQQTWKKGGGC